MVAAGLVPADGNHGVVSLCEAEGHGAADAGGGADDEGDAVREAGGGVAGANGGERHL